MKSFATSTNPWAAKFRKFAKDTHGVDFANPPPPNTLVSNWNPKTTMVKATR
ncbi:MAG: hypothetical protein V4510_03165 [bacterium]